MTGDIESSKLNFQFALAYILFLLVFCLCISFFLFFNFRSNLWTHFCFVFHLWQSSTHGWDDCRTMTNWSSIWLPVSWRDWMWTSSRTHRKDWWFQIHSLYKCIRDPGIVYIYKMFRPVTGAKRYNVRVNTTGKNEHVRSKR